MAKLTEKMKKDFIYGCNEIGGEVSQERELTCKLGDVKFGIYQIGGPEAEPGIIAGKENKGEVKLRDIHNINSEGGTYRGRMEFFGEGQRSLSVEAEGPSIGISGPDFSGTVGEIEEQTI